MEALAHVVQYDPGLLVPRQGKAHAVGVPVCGHAAASAGITNIAELAQLIF
jgi:hypothetical protein